MFSCSFVKKSITLWPKEYFKGKQIFIIYKGYCKKVIENTINGLKTILQGKQVFNTQFGQTKCKLRPTLK